MPDENPVERDEKFAQFDYLIGKLGLHDRAAKFWEQDEKLTAAVAADPTGEQVCDLVYNLGTGSLEVRPLDDSDD